MTLHASFEIQEIEEEEMKKVKLLLIAALIAVMVLSLVACNKEDGKGGGESPNVAGGKYEGKTNDRVLSEKIVIKYPAVFKIDNMWSNDSTVILSLEGADWELEITCIEYSKENFENFEAIKDFHDAIYGDKVEKVTLLNNEGIKVDKSNALSIFVPIDEKLYFLFNCKQAADKECDCNAAFATPEVQYILENINFK